MAKRKKIKPAKKKAPKVDLLKLHLVVVRLLDGLCAEVVRGVPSHTWDKLGQVRQDIRNLRTELEGMTDGTNAG